MLLKPCNNRILAKLHFKDTTIVLPDETCFDPRVGDDIRPKVEVLDVADGVTNCKKGDFLLLHPSVNVLPVSKEEKTILFDAGSVLAIVKDDVIPMTLN